MDAAADTPDSDEELVLLPEEMQLLGALDDAEEAADEELEDEEEAWEIDDEMIAEMEAQGLLVDESSDEEAVTEQQVCFAVCI